jgi:hypothetical protein
MAQLRRSAEQLMNSFIELRNAVYRVNGEELGAKIKNLENRYKLWFEDVDGMD